ncbi:hypothetical protein SPHINGO8BC_20056 [Sphingobacterium multivorum]|uniref:Uncharacterized protein n=1 Tax=Sphingobacterium multivorum TaxID=28454 RepID=A0A654BAV3_SPHMU|nr:hypothetical protein SPHINGO8BC_20056 [Sphingobacterium multivorum]
MIYSQVGYSIQNVAKSFIWNIIKASSVKLVIVDEILRLVGPAGDFRKMSKNI